MTLLQQIVLALVGIICLTIFAAAIVLGVIAYAELFLRDHDAEGMIEEKKDKPQ